ncbi:MAG TPA: hypothetical protein VFJ46_17725 [Xanthobacteraceae bacterium]|nr:hypothetical protein [Xanthobacteraceae bacterium]
MPDLFGAPDAEERRQHARVSQAGFTYEDKRAAAQREVDFRRRVYPRWVAQRKLSQGEADRQIDIMADIARDYAKCVELEQRPLEVMKRG